MATTIVQVRMAPGIAGATATFYPDGSDTAVASGKTLTEQSSRKGFYQCSVTEALDGVHDIVLATSGGDEFGQRRVKLADDNATYEAHEPVTVEDDEGNPQPVLDAQGNARNVLELMPGVKPVRVEIADVDKLIRDRATDGDTKPGQAMAATYAVIYTEGVRQGLLGIGCMHTACMFMRRAFALLHEYFPQCSLRIV